ncbi:MAG: hypothetical protein R3A44_38090 [Caldilineaceae bacterium]
MSLTELLPSIRQLPAFEKVRLIRILAEELGTTEDISPLQPNKLYYLPTPYNSFGAGRALMNAMAKTAEA